jgi:hypothetical protein
LFDDDPCRDAWLIGQRLPMRVVRRLLADLVNQRDADAAVRLRGALGPCAACLDLGDPEFREYLLESLDYRVSPPDEEDPGPTSPFGDSRTPAERRDVPGEWTCVVALEPAVWSCP